MQNFSHNHINEEKIKSSLHNYIIGKHLIVLESVDSTNEYLKRLGNSGSENGTVVTSREQTKGKGRLGRSWVCKKDDSLTFSVLLRPKITPSEVSSITPLSGLAICKALREYTGLDCKIKWPNDIIFKNKKLSGILTEMSIEGNEVEYIVTGIGLNVSQTEFPQEIAHKATSVFLETDKDIDKSELLAVLLEYMEHEFLKNNLELSSTALEEYTSLCATIGKRVIIEIGHDKISGTATRILPDGELEVITDDGKAYNVNHGLTVVQGIY